MSSQQTNDAQREADQPKLPRLAPKVDLPTKRRRRHLNSNKPRRDNRKSRFDPDYTPDDARNNEAFSNYYKAQKIVQPDEFETMLNTFAKPLPTSFRIAAQGTFREDIHAAITGDITNLFRDAASSNNSEQVDPPKHLPWYPNQLAWTVSAPRQLLRRDNALAPFRRFLVRMHSIGAINRQEAVSMIPPLLLRAQPGDSVLDMCAAPGSKTAQILENLSQRGIPLSEPGLVIANDADIKRCWMLVHQLKRFASPQLIVTHHEAQQFPAFMAFDRVLCDVPCTGDGTLRKAPDIWRRWSPEMGIGIHRLQIQILTRGIELLKPGGRLVYSTCSMNPLENEAVVAHALRKFEHDVELVDCSTQLPKLVRRKGLTTWLVKDTAPVRTQDMESKEECQQNMNKEPASAAAHVDENVHHASSRTTPDLGKSSRPTLEGWFTSFEQVPLRRRKKVVSSLFPPSVEELRGGKFPLERCMRLVPHDQDTGAFFVSVFVKSMSCSLTRRQNRNADLIDPSGEIDPEESGGAIRIGEDHQLQQSEEKKKPLIPKRNVLGGTRLITDDPLVNVYDLCSKTLAEISSFFGLDTNITRHCLLTRGSDGSSFKRIVAVSGTVRSVLRHALGTRDKEVPEEKRSLRVVHAGVRVLERTDRNDTICHFRLIHEGAHIMRAIMKARCVNANVSGVLNLLTEDVIRRDSAGELENLFSLGSGSAILCCGEREEVIAWIGKRVISTVMPKEVVLAMQSQLRRLCGQQINLLSTETTNETENKEDRSGS